MTQCESTFLGAQCERTAWHFGEHRTVTQHFDIDGCVLNYYAAWSVEAADGGAA